MCLTTKIQKGCITRKFYFAIQSMYIVRFKHRNSHYVLHFKLRDCPYINTLPCKTERIAK